jgi:hypothetical protein
LNGWVRLLAGLIKHYPARHYVAVGFPQILGRCHSAAAPLATGDIGIGARSIDFPWMHLVERRQANNILTNFQQ